MAHGQERGSPLEQPCVQLLPDYVKEQADILRSKVTTGPASFLSGCQSLIEQSMRSQAETMPAGLSAAIDHCIAHMPQAIEAQLAVAVADREIRRLRAEESVQKARSEALEIEERVERERQETHRLAAAKRSAGGEVEAPAVSAGSHDEAARTRAASEVVPILDN